jgi:hypothetical protein
MDAIDKNTLMTPTRDKSQHIPHVSHTGAPHPDHYAKKGEPGLVSHPNHPVNQATGQIEQTHVRADLGVAPKVKRYLTEAPPINSGMATRFRKDVGTAFGADHSSAIDALTGLRVPADKSGKVAVAHPLTKIAPPKNMKPVAPVPGQRSRVDECEVEGIGAAAARAQANRDALHAARHEIGRRVIEDAIAEHAGKPFEWRANRGQK